MSSVSNFEPRVPKATPQIHARASTCSWPLARALALGGTLLLFTAKHARAQEVVIIQESPGRNETSSWTQNIALGVAGALSGLVLHEAGHVFANLALGNVPHFNVTKSLGFIPFVVISPGVHCEGDRCTKRNGHSLPMGRNGFFLIATAGFEVQHIVDEIILTRNPHVAYEYAPYQQGLLAFNVFLSVLYAGGALTGLENPHGDLRSAASRLGVDERVCAAFLLIPAALDVYRFFRPSATWAIWASRTTKASMLVLTLAF